MNSKTGRIERVFVDLQAVYPDEQASCEERSFEELRAKSRGWLDQDWSKKRKQPSVQQGPYMQDTQEHDQSSKVTISNVINVVDEKLLQPTKHLGSEIRSSPSTTSEITNLVNVGRESKNGRQRKTKIREVKGETQTSIFVFDRSK